VTEMRKTSKIFVGIPMDVKSPLATWKVCAWVGKVMLICHEETGLRIRSSGCTVRRFGSVFLTS